MTTGTPICDFGWKAVDFTLPDPEGRSYTLEALRGPKGTVVMFICNHCPYVRAVADQIAEDARALQAMGIAVVAIMPNDFERYPEDSPDKMVSFARQHGFTFPYLIDAAQTVAKAYDAVCTPDFFGFNADLELQYRGRLDESKKSAAAGARRELLDAMRAISETGRGPKEQTASIGCSIKWREADTE